MRIIVYNGIGSKSDARSILVPPDGTLLSFAIDASRYHSGNVEQELTFFVENAETARKIGDLFYAAHAEKIAGQEA